MEVAPVDEREADLRIDPEAPRGVQPGEPATDDRRRDAAGEASRRRRRGRRCPESSEASSTPSCRTSILTTRSVSTSAQAKRVAVGRRSRLAGQHAGHDLEDAGVGSLRISAIAVVASAMTPIRAYAATRIVPRPASARDRSSAASTTNVPSGSVEVAVDGPGWLRRPHADAGCAAGGGPRAPRRPSRPRRLPARRASSRARCARASPTPIPRSSGSQRGGRACASDILGAGRYLSRSALARTAWAAASRATGTRNGEHET